MGTCSLRCHFDAALICPDYTDTQQKPQGAPAYGELDALYVIGDKVAPRTTLKDALERIRQVMDCNLNEKLWDDDIEEIGGYQAD